MEPQHILDPTSTIILLGLAQLYGDGVKLSMGNSVPHQMTIQPAGKWQSVSRTITMFTSVVFSEKNNDNRTELWRLRPLCVKAAKLLSPKMVFPEQPPKGKDAPPEPEVSKSLKIIFNWALQGLQLGPKKTYESEKTNEGYSAAANVDHACQALEFTLKGRVKQIPDCPGLDVLDKIDFSNLYTDDELESVGKIFSCIDLARKAGRHNEYMNHAKAIVVIVEGVTENKLIPLLKNHEKK